MRHIARSTLWVLAGPAAGLVVLGGLAPPLFLIDAQVANAGPPDYGIALVAGMIAGVWGLVGGLASGAVCAAITSALDVRMKRTTAGLYAKIAAIVTAVLALPVAVTQLFSAGPATIWDVVVWVLVPISVSAAAASWVGGWIWRRTRPGPLAAT